jgi:hypothetical protein
MGGVFGDTKNMEKYASIKEYCKTLEYQTWQNQWQPPVNDITWFNEEDDLWDTYHTHRQKIWNKCASRIPFYLLDTIEPGTNRCVDIGCGGNFLNQHNLNVWGVDCTNNTSTIQDEELTLTWYDDNYEKWSKAISMNAIHFYPVQEIGESLSNIENILTPGGTGVVTLNRGKIEKCSDTYTDELLIEQISTISTVTRVVWFDSPEESYLDGNVWIWINK